MKKCIVLLTLFLWPHFSLAASFDCSKAASLAEMTICNDPVLSKMDDELSEIYKQAKVKATDSKTFKQQTQAAWKWRETNCHSRECLINWYEQRKIVLKKIIDSTVDNGCLVRGPVTLEGFVISQKLTLEPDGRTSTVYLLNTENDICVKVEPIDVGEIKNENTNKFQLVSYDNKYKYSDVKKYLFKKVRIEGMLSTDNITQYYAEKFAIDIKKMSDVK